MNRVLFLRVHGFLTNVGWLDIGGAFINCRVVGYWESLINCGVVGYWSVLGDYYKLTQQWPNLHLEKKSP